MAETTNQDLMKLPLNQAVQLYAPQMAVAFPSRIACNQGRLVRVIQSTLTFFPDLQHKCDRASLFRALARCAQDGLYPDGREAALVPYGKEVQYIPMYKGMLKLISNYVLSVTTEVVCEHDYFEREMGDDARISHRAPPLDQDRGEMIGVYCLIRLKTGDLIREVMPKSEVERIRTTYSKNTRDDAPWKREYNEMARKTVFRRAVKWVPIEDEEIARVFDRPDDDEIPLAEVAAPPRISDEDVTENGPKRQRQRKAAPVSEVIPPEREGRLPPEMEPGDFDDEMPPLPGEDAEPAGRDADAGSAPQVTPAYSFGDSVGEVFEFDSVAEAVAAYTEFLEKAAKDPKAIATLWDNGHNLRAALVNDGKHEIVKALAELHDRLTMQQRADAPKNLREVAEAPKTNGQDFIIPFDGERTQAWYRDAIAKLKAMQAASAPPADFAAFKQQNAKALAALEKGENAFPSLFRPLNQILTYETRPR